MVDFNQHMTRVIIRVVLRDETCGLLPPAGLSCSDTTLPVEKMRFALRVLHRLRCTGPSKGRVVTEEELAREIAFLQSTSLFNVTKAIVRKLTLAPIAFMLRKEHNDYHIPLEIFALGAMLVSNV